MRSSDTLVLWKLDRLDRRSFAQRPSCAHPRIRVQDVKMKWGNIMVQPSKKTAKTLQLPFSESALLDGLTPHSAHAEEVAVPFLTELAPGESCRSTTISVRSKEAEKT
ncbi:hypothetical protein [Vreelandella rituensis]|uniref:hypothetical protein n=1 Tax=Vreelandella rituensis TaxID=2282306 RepID=UPI0039EE26AB